MRLIIWIRIYTLTIENVRDYAAKDDELGRKLQDLDLPVRKRVTKKG